MLVDDIKKTVDDGRTSKTGLCGPGCQPKVIVLENKFTLVPPKGFAFPYGKRIVQ